jgi:hypothetical protein
MKASYSLLAGAAALGGVLLLQLSVEAASAPEHSAKSRLLTLRPLDGPFPLSARGCLDQQDRWCAHDFLDLGPEAPSGFRQIALATAREDSHPRLLLYVTTTDGEFIADLGALPGKTPPETGSIVARTQGTMLMVGLGWGFALSSTKMIACEHRVMACDISSEGVPACGQRLTEQAAHCRKDDVASGLTTPTPSLVVDDKMARPPTQKLVRSTVANEQRKVLRTLHFTDLPSVTGIGIVLHEGSADYWIEVDGSRALFFSHGPIAQATVGRDVGYFRRQTLKDIELFTWSSGSGIIDPPDSSYGACRHHVMACVFRAGVPLCSEPQVVARVSRRRCDGNQPTGLTDSVPEAKLLRGGRAFKIAGQSFEISVESASPNAP